MSKHQVIHVRLPSNVTALMEKLVKTRGMSRNQFVVEVITEKVAREMRLQSLQETRGILKPKDAPEWFELPAVEWGQKPGGGERTVLMEYLIDTCVFIDHLTGRLSPEACAWLERVAAAGEAVTSAVVYHELLYGARTAKAQAVVKNLLAAWEVLAVNRQVAERAAELRQQQAAARKIVGMANSLVAATATLHGLKVVTGNIKDFPAVTALLPEEVAHQKG